MVSIVMPAYNEVDIIRATVEEWSREVVRRIPGAELIVVDDCSKDGTGAVLDGLAAQMPWLRVVRPPHNGGHGKALLLGFQSSQCDFIFQTDSDRQHLPEEFWKL
jgi:dolichol-phosphate mannosyltransferase